MIRVIKQLCGKKVKFVLVGTQRSGTTLLSEYLASHPDIHMGRELFKVSGEGRNVDADSYRYSERSVEAFLDDFFARRLEGVRACGFKVMADQLQRYPAILEYIREQGIVCIYLERLNIVDTALSRLLARKRNVYHSEEQRSFAPETLDADSLLEELGIIVKTHRFLYEALINLKTLTVYYEALVADKRETMIPVLTRLGVRIDAPLSSPLQKLNPGPLEAQVDNAADILRRLDRTKYAMYVRKKPLGKPFNETTGSVFVHIPKVAGSSIEKALYGTRGAVGHRSAMEWMLNDTVRFKRSYTFAFCRHPLDRFVSAYTYLREGGRNRFDAAWAEAHILPYPSFRAFVLALKSDDTHKEAVLGWMHFRPQHTFVCDANLNLLVDFVGRYESLADDFGHIAWRLGINVSLPHENATPQRERYESYYDEETRAIVSDLYRSDFVRFGYVV